MRGKHRAAGEVDEDELREYLLAKKKEGRLRKDVDTRVGTIMEKYDMGAKGFLDLGEFIEMQKEVTIAAPVDLNKEVGEMKTELRELTAKVDLIVQALGRMSGGPTEAEVEAAMKAVRD